MNLTRSLLLAALLAPACAHADALADLRTALTRLPAKAPLAARVQVQGESRQGNDTTPIAGSVQVDDGATGLRLSYGPDLTARLATEARATAATPPEQSPPAGRAKATLAKLDLESVRLLANAGEVLAAQLDRATACAPEAEAQLGGKPARLLSCTLRRPAMSERERGYVKQYDGKLDLWLAPDGTPLAAKRNETVSGRAMVVISFETQFAVEASYAVVGDRLVATRLESRQNGSGAGERGDSKLVWTLTPR